MPIAWWVLSALFALSMLLAVGLYLGPAWGIGTAVVCFAAMAAVFAAAALTITVTDRWLTVGRASVELDYVGEARALDAQQARRRRGPEADARAFLALRPYVPTAVEIELTDAEDPAPYWLVSSRRPRLLVAALAAATAARVEPRTT